MKVGIFAITAAALAAAACGSDPVYYDQPRYGSGAYYSRTADSADFGRVVAIDVIGERRTTGAGAVVGGIVGGVLGHQVGSGRGNDAATVAGAVGGAVVGNEIEKRRNDGERYRITVRSRDGRDSVFEQDSLDGIRVGDRVRIDGGRLFRD
jgi:outer membrane lipoprotein SlyB